MEYIKMVDEFMQVMGQETPEKPTIPSTRIQELRWSLITEENKELLEAAISNDIVEVVDALCDLRYVVEGAFRAYGFSPELADELFREVQSSNMSKSCADLEEARRTRFKLSEINKNRVDDYVITQVGDRFIVARKSDMKVLKSINFKEPDLESILKKHNVL